MARREYRLGDLQLAIMKVLWARGPTAVADVHRALPNGADLAPTTVATMLRKMEDKGLARHRVEGRKFLYEAAVSEAAVSSSMADHLLDRVFEGSLADLVCHLLDSRKVSPGELDQIARWIAERKSKS